MSIVDIAKVKEYLRIDGDYDDALLQSLISSAEAYIDGAVGNLAEKLSDEKAHLLAELAVMMLVKEYYDNRDGKESGIPNHVSRILLQLQYMGGDIHAD